MNNESGYTLLGALLTFAILSILGISLVTVTFASLKTSSNERDNQAVYYIAEAGLNYLANEMELAINEIYENKDVKTEEDFFHEINKLINMKVLPGQYDKFEKINEYKPFARLSIDVVSEENGEYRLQSIGQLENEQRQVSQSITVEWKEKFVEVPGSSFELPPLAVFTSGAMNLTNGPIEGNIGTISTEEHAIKVGQGVRKVTEEVFVPVIEHSDLNRTCQENPANKYKSYSITRPTWENNVPCPTEKEDMWGFPSLPPFPDAPTNFVIPEDMDVNGFKLIDHGNLHVTDSKVNHYELTLNGNTKFNQISINDNRNITINTGNTDKTIIVNHLNISNGHIHIKGKGSLMLHVLDKITMGRGSTINEGKSKTNADQIEKVNIFYHGNGSVTLSGNQKIYGSIFMKHANLTATGSGGIYGNIFSGGESITFTGGSDAVSQLILAPNATFTVGAGGSIYGIIISKDFNHNSGQKVVYSEPYVLKGPISPIVMGESDKSEPDENNSGTHDTVEIGSKPLIHKDAIREIK